MTDSPAEPRTGLFYRKQSDDYVVLWKGREICTYDSVEDFVQDHEKGLQALETNQAELLGSYYKSL